MVSPLEGAPYDPTAINLPGLADALAKHACIERDDGDGSQSSPCACVSIGAAQAKVVSQALRAIAAKFDDAERVAGTLQPFCHLMLGEQQLAAVVSALRGTEERMRSVRFYSTGEPDAPAAPEPVR